MATRAKWGIAGVVLFIFGAYVESPFFMLIGFIAVLAAVLCDQKSLTMGGDTITRQVMTPGPYRVRLVSSGQKKINVIKIMRQFTNLGLKEAKDLADSAPVDIVSSVSEENALELKEALEQEGAVVVVTSSVGKELAEIEDSLDDETQDPIPLFQRPGAWVPGPYKAVLVDAGDRKINVIKITRELFGLGLKEAKDLVDSAPVILIDGVSQENAQYIESRYQSEGAKVAITHLQVQFTDGQYPQSSPAPVQLKSGQNRFSQGNCDVILNSPGPNKAETAWVLSTILGFDAGAAEEILNRPQSRVVSGVSEQDANMIKRVLEDRGASVSLSSMGQPDAPAAQPASQPPRVRRKNRVKE